MASKEEPIKQSGCVPYRLRNGDIEFCAITTRKGRWGFPKGIIDAGETPEETAAKEAEEEAGLLGRIAGKPIGSYRYRKWGTGLVCTMFLMRVVHEEDTWDESWRQRGWFTPDAAREIIDREELLCLVDAAEKRVRRELAESANRKKSAG